MLPLLFNNGVNLMRSTFFSSLLYVLFASLSWTAVAAPSSAPGELSVSASSVSVTGHTKLDLNSADAATLQRELSGIGKTKAESIVAYRDANGHFASVDELLEVKGIGKALLDSNRHKLIVE